jgi:hypothetical protein
MGWTVAAGLQSRGYDQLTQTVSALAAYGATDRWVMTGALYAAGACYMATALGLRSVAAAGRWTLACGGAASMLVASFPQPAGGAAPGAHVAALVIGSSAMTVWPLFACTRRPGRPWILSPSIGLSVTGLFVALSAWFLVEANTGGPVGLAERIDGGTESLWPLIVAVGLLYQRPPGGSATIPQNPR